MAKFFAVCVVLISIISADVFMARKAHHYIVRREAFFEDFLEKFKAQEDTSQDYCEVRNIYSVYRYQLCFIRIPKGVPSRGTISFIYHRPQPVSLRQLDTENLYFRDPIYGVSPKVINKDFIVIYENDRWD